MIQKESTLTGTKKDIHESEDKSFQPRSHLNTPHTNVAHLQIT